MDVFDDIIIKTGVNKLYRKISEFWKNYYTKLLLTYVILMALALFVIYSLIVYTIIPLFKQQIIDNNIRVLAQMSNELTDRYYKVDAASSLIYEVDLEDAANKDNTYTKDNSINYLMNEIKGIPSDKWDQLNAFDKLCKQIVRMVDGVDSVFLISQKGKVLSNSNYTSIDDSYDFLAKDWFKNLRGVGIKKLQILGPDNPTDYYYLGNREGIVTFARNIFSPQETYSNEILGTLLINVNSTMFEKMMNIFDINWVKDYAILAPNGLVAFDKNGQYFGKKLPFSQKLASLSAEESGNFHYLIDGNSNTVSFYRSKQTGYVFLTIVTYDYIDRELGGIKKYMFIAVGLFLLAGLLFSCFSARNRYKPIRILLSSMKYVESGNLDVRIENVADNDIGLIMTGYNRMADKLKKFVNDVYVVKLKKKDAELCALKSQVDSHFLGNILEAIRARSFENNDRDTAEVLKLLGKYYREKLALDDDLIEISRELMITESYIKLEEYKGVKKINFISGIDNLFLGLLIPKFTFQPLVENSIHHGCMREQEITVRIDAKLDNDTLTIRISDNGIGINADKLDELRTFLEGSLDLHNSKHIGIKNVNNRLKLYYGDNFGVKIDSNPGYGTTIYVTIPVNGGM